MESNALIDTPRITINSSAVSLETLKKYLRPTSLFWNFRFIALASFAFCFIEVSHSLGAEGVESTPVINTTTGPVQGEVLTTVVKNFKYSSFRSIRYAEPPYGEQRFKPPVPVKPWTEVLNATVEANACPQFNLIIREFIGSEDCLFINIFTPLTVFNTNDRKAVMVWIYGGSYISGNARTNFYGADFLIEDDVILVTFNYRVGPLGFLSLKHTKATGNAAMKDQVLALQWIKENIEKFGGNPERITIFGNSAGAVSVDLHTLSESSRGLFHGAISISGSVFNPWAIHKPEEAVLKAFELGRVLGINTMDEDILLRGLYNATILEISKATTLMDETMPPFRPTIEDPTLAADHAFLTESVLNKYKNGDFIKVPYITGFTEQETVSMTTDGMFEPISNLVKPIIAEIEKINQSLPIDSPLLDDLIKNATTSIKLIPDVVRAELIKRNSFDYFSAGIDVKQRFLNDKSSEPVYYYQVSFDPVNSLHNLLLNVTSRGAGHMDDLAYIFYMPIIDLPLNEDDPISITRRRMVRMWTNFAKYGNPTPIGAADEILNITWPASGSLGLHLEIGEELSIGERPVNAEELYHQLLGNQTVGPKNSEL